MSQLSTPGLRPTVHELQQLAREAGKRRPRRRRLLSRAARLSLIDAMSRSATAGLALIAGVSIFVAVSAGALYPLRAGVWAVMVMAALYLSRRLTKDFRAGRRSAARPFRWRANYTASLVVVAAAFGAGALIVFPEGAPSELSYQSLTLILAAAYGAAFLHAAHGRAAAALALPAAACVLGSALRIGGLAGPFAALAGASLAGLAAIYFLRRYMRARAASRFPRTSYQRREAEPPSLSGAADAEGARRPASA